MPHTTSSRARFFDFLLIGRYQAIMSPQDRKYFQRGNLLACVLGVCEGISLYLIIPTVLSFSAQNPVLGLGWQAWIGMLAILAVLGAVVTYAQQMLSYQCAMGILQHTSLDMGDNIAKLPLGWFRSDFGAQFSRTCTKSIIFLGSGIAHLLSVAIRAISCTIALLIPSLIFFPPIGLAFLIAIPFVLVLLALSRVLKNKAEALTVNSSAELASRLVEFAHTQPVLRSAGRSDNYAPLLQAEDVENRQAHKKLWLSTLSLVFGGIIVQALTVALILVIAVIGAHGSLDPVLAVALLGISLRYSKVIDTGLGMWNGLQASLPPLDAVQNILEAKPLPTPADTASLPTPGSVEFDQVSFGYDSRTVLQDVSFKVKPHSLCAIVGPSGSGKTTLFRLIARFWDVDSGSVRIGGVNVREQPTAQLMDQLSMVFQDVYLFDSSLFDNISIGRQDATDEEVYAAAQLAGVDEIVRRLPKGWDTRVGEGGGRLSGGERQRVSVARALLKQSPILLFDEATSALDPENEAQIERAIATLRKNSTVLVIAHRLNTVRNADQIIVLDHQGRVTQVGTHEELITQDGLYQSLCSARERSQGWSLV